MEELTELIDEKGVLNISSARKAGVTKEAFYQFVNDNNLERIGHGIYATEDAWVDDLYLLHKRCPAAVFSHEEALYYHRLTDREPLVHTLTIYTGYNTKRLTESGCRVFTVKRDLLDIGKIMITDNYGNTIPMYDLERTICDIVRSRSRIEAQDFNSALKDYVRRNDKDLNRLMKYAELFHVDHVIQKYMEVLL
jgi:predicted transcriptional regulator of viral defense system